MAGSQRPAFDRREVSGHLPLGAPGRTRRFPDPIRRFFDLENDSSDQVRHFFDLENDFPDQVRRFFDQENGFPDQVRHFFAKEIVPLTKSAVFLAKKSLARSSP